MPLTHLRIAGRDVTFDEALELAKEGKAHLPYPFVKAIVASIQNRQSFARDDQMSVTDVTGCPRAKTIKALEAYSEEPENLMAAFRGQLLHQLLAKYAEQEATVETRTSRDFGGYTLYGTADSIITTRANGKYKLRDFKSTKRIPQYGPWSNHKEQTNIYRWLYELPSDGTDISVIYFDLNGAEVAERFVSPWTDKMVEDFLGQRFLPAARALEEKKLIPYREVPADILSWMCAWCPVYHSCFGHLLEEENALVHFAQNTQMRKK